MLVFQDSKMRHFFDFKSRVRCSRGRGKGVLFLRQIWRFMLPSKVMPCFPVFKDNQGAVQLAQNPITNSIRSTLTCVITFFENLSARGTLR